ncbi:AMP phosphorylase [Candidatus Woesearchaeota archaeon]|nr:AMP phosphorylase [Candidatus Woesearchaeota archaeon]
MDISTGGVQVVILNQEDARMYDLKVEDRVKIRNNGRTTIAVVDIAESDKIVKPGHIGMFEESLRAIKARNGNIIDVQLDDKPLSVRLIRKKLDKKELSYDEMDQIVKDIINNELDEIELTYFIAACYNNGMSYQEILALTKSMVKNSDTLTFDRKPVMDLHCIGGVPGNRTTMIVIPIIAAAGLLIPKTSSRAITSPAGTADTMEVLCNVSFNTRKLMSIIKKTNGCIVWGGALNLASADDKLIKLRYPLSLDPMGMLIASIVAKKHSVGSTHILLEIPIGHQTKLATKEEALHLEREFINVGKRLGMRFKILITDGSQPVGNGIGCALEAKDVLYCLMNHENAPKDLLQKSITIAGMMLEMAGKAKKGRGHLMAQELVESGIAFQKMQEIIKLQGGKGKLDPDRIKVGKYEHDVVAENSGIIKGINNKDINKISRIAGSPKDLGAGIYLHHHVGDMVKKGEALFTIHSDSKKRMDYAKNFLEFAEPFFI